MGRAIFVKQYQVSSSSGLFKFSGSCATQDINREIWCDTHKISGCVLSRVHSKGGVWVLCHLGKCCFLNFGVRIIFATSRGQNRLAKNINGFNHFAVCLSLCYFHGHLNSVNQSMYGKDWNPGICPPLCICFSTKKHQRRKHLENTIRDARSTSP